MAGLVRRLRFAREDVLAADAPTNRTLMVKAGAWLFLGGGVLVLLVLVLPHDQRISEVGLLAVSAGCFAGAVVVLLRFESLSLGALELLAAYGSVLATAARHFAEEGAETGTGIQALYLWIVLYAAFFFARRRAVLQVVWIGLLYAAVLASEPTSSATVTLWTVTIAGLFVATLVVGALRERPRSRRAPCRSGANRSADRATQPPRVRRAVRPRAATFAPHRPAVQRAPR